MPFAVLMVCFSSAFFGHSSSHFWNKRLVHFQEENSSSTIFFRYFFEHFKCVSFSVGISMTTFNGFWCLETWILEKFPSNTHRKKKRDRQLRKAFSPNKMAIDCKYCNDNSTYSKSTSFLTETISCDGYNGSTKVTWISVSALFAFWIETINHWPFA